MSNYTKWLKALCAHMTQKQLVVIDRGSGSPNEIHGYIVAISTSFLLLHKMSDDMYLDGYSVVPISDVLRYRILRDHKSFADRALKARGQAPVAQPKINLDDFSSVIESSNRAFPLITIHRERMHADECYIGTIAKITDKAVTLKEIDPSARWSRTRRYNFKDITQVQFGGSYESALWLVHCRESGDKRLFKRALAADRTFDNRSH